LTDAPTARIVAVQDDFVEIEAFGRPDGTLVMNEVVYIPPSRLDSDGRQAPLKSLATQYRTFMPRGADFAALDPDAKWFFDSNVTCGDIVRAVDALGTVPEAHFTHKIMVPFNWRGDWTVSWSQKGASRVDEPAARLFDAEGNEREIILNQRWSVRRALPADVLKSAISRRTFPNEPVLTSQRLIDTFFPVAHGGTACIPGPFGAGKTVLQNLIARNAKVAIVIVAAREATIFTGIIMGEYYRQIGYDVLLIADSTSRWAQVMRETSARLEEIPSEEGFPAYLESAIKGI